MDEVINEDIKNIEQDTKEIQCSPISRFIYHTIKLFKDLLTYCCMSNKID